MTRRRLLTLILALYPPWWRERYGAEAAAIADQTRLDLRSWFDLLRGAVDAWTRQRRPEPGFARFADDARMVIVLAQMEARALGHDYVGTEHVLLGLLAARDAVAAHALLALGVSSERVRGRLLQVLEQGGVSSPPRCTRTPPSSELPSRAMRLTPRTKMGFELSGRAADHTGDPDIGAAHLLLGLLDEDEGIGPTILAEFARPEAIRAELAPRMRRRSAAA